MAGERDPLHPRLAHEETLDLVRAATEALAALIDSGALKTKVEGLTFDPDVDIGDVHLLDTADAKIDPATEGKQDAIVAALASLAQESGGNLATCATELGTIDTSLGLVKTYTSRIPTDPAREGGKLTTIDQDTSAIAKDHTAAARMPGMVSRATEINEVPVSLVASSTPYVRAWVQATKPGSFYGGSPGGGGLPSSNADDVYISLRAEGHYWTLVPGASVQLPPCCNLYDFDLTAKAGGDGVVVMYET